MHIFLPNSHLWHGTKCHKDCAQTPWRSQKRALSVFRKNQVSKGYIKLKVVPKGNYLFRGWTLVGQRSKHHRWTASPLTETSDREIYQAVINAIDARENIEINGGDNVDDVPLVEPRPTRHEVRKAVATIGKYIDDIDDPVARKMESILGSFNRQLRLEEARTMKNTSITDFFKQL